MELIQNDYSIIYKIGYKDIRIHRPNGYQVVKYITLFRVIAVFWFLVFLAKLIVACIQVLTAIAKE